jgi:hypothetical protein
MTDEAPDKPPGELPSLELAYKLGVASYEAISKRLDNVDARIQSIITLSITVIALSPALATARSLSFGSRWFIAAAVAAALLLVTGSLGRLIGKTYEIVPGRLEPWLEDEPAVFRNNFLIYAAQDFEENAKLLRRNWRLSVLVNVLFFLEVIALVIWGAVAVVAKAPAAV